MAAGVQYKSVFDVVDDQEDQGGILDLEPELLPSEETAGRRGFAAGRFVKILGAALLVAGLAGSAFYFSGAHTHFAVSSEALKRLQELEAWCENQPAAPKLWAPAAGPPLKVKALSYNLFWWNLFGTRKGNGGSAGKLIAAANTPEPFDVMGFQECGSGTWVMGDAGLLDTYHLFQGAYGKCMAFRKASWTLLAQGDTDVAADVWWNNYGRRGMQWMRLKHLDTDQVLFFANFHGPLSVNSGGLCGGVDTAKRMLNVIASNAVQGDAIILVGDFNSNAASLTVQELRKSLVHAYNGASFGGVDNFFTNAAGSQVKNTLNLGSGGSDHDALAVVIDLGDSGEPAAPPAAVQAVTALSKSSPGYEWPAFWCGLEENNVEYEFDTAVGVWSNVVPNTNSPDWCCRSCQAEPRCAAWTWVAGNLPGAKECRMHGAGPISKVAKTDVVSGLSAPQAAKAALLVPSLPGF